MSESNPEFVFKILDTETWSAAGTDLVPAMPIDIKDGYIHLSTAEQLAETLALHFKGQSDVTILAIRTAGIEQNIKWEPSRGGQLFPHVYGDLPRGAVAAIGTVAVDPDGACILPDWIN